MADRNKKAGKDAAPIILESQQRLSRSILWKLQRRFFEQQGIDAWQQGIVPHYITNNPFIARAYAKVVLGFLRDCQGDQSGIDRSQPIYIIEPGAGSGRFAYHFLKIFHDLRALSTFRDLRFVYVMTDFATRTIDDWQKHPALSALAASGLLDFAQFDAEHPADLALIKARHTLSPNAVGNPLIVIANYWFDSIPQDCFTFRHNQVFENLITVSVPPPVPDMTDPDLIRRIDFSYEERPAKVDYYGDSDFDDILKQYAKLLKGSTLLFPTAAIDCIRYFKNLSDGRLLVITGDKGYSKEADLLRSGEPGLAVHGSFSFSVNYHAIGEYFRFQGGQFWQTPHYHNDLNILAFVAGPQAHEYDETALAYEEAIVQGGPDDFFNLKTAVEKHYPEMSLENILAYLRLSGWDSNIFLSGFSTLIEQVESATEMGRQNLIEAAHQVWEMHFPMSDERDLPFNLGLLMYRMRKFAEALVYFQHSARLYGEETPTVYNMGLCYYGLHDLESAQERFDHALRLDPTYGPARDMQTRIQAEKP